MADYYVDFSAGSNGTGTAASPWYQFTATESATVSGGDNVWFRRKDVTVNTKVIAWKAGASSTSRINYIGWPKPGDDYYSVREPSLQATWDVDVADYVYQRQNVAATPAATLVNYINLYRIQIRHDRIKRFTFTYKI